MKQIPQLSYDLIQELDKLFPNTVARKSETWEDHLRRAGARDVVNFLLSQLKKDQENGRVLS